MKLLSWGKDGGPESRVWGFWLCEFKSLFSIVLLKFEDGSRDAYHSHAFNAVSWVLRGKLVEHVLWAYRRTWREVYRPSFWPVFTPRSRMHKVRSEGTTWVLSFRGPWSKTWSEYLPSEHRAVNLTHGRREV